MNFFKKRREELQAAAGETVSQHDLAIRIGITSAGVGAWERELFPPRLTLAPKLAEVYQVSVERIEQEIVQMNRRIAAKKMATAGAR